ncbi:hypothetical protein [Demequina litorisediminis]|uniref:Transposase n=1 Tax=Demequina litorisediminis TaxID=1849022 RepID=A0ABQ6IAQ4_9MICO|nr:hypothetical protein [Demequina litorisediminis]GMA34744.1 hypothetical protein GCM10025876_09480 [Demequina litorisediminis]
MSMVTRNWDRITAAFRRGKDKVVGWLQKAWDFVKKVWSYNPVSLVTDNWDKIVAYVKDIPSKMASGLSSLYDKAHLAVQEGVQRHRGLLEPHGRQGVLHDPVMGAWWDRRQRLVRAEHPDARVRWNRDTRHARHDW